MKKTYRIKLKLKTALHINAGTGGDGKRLAVKSIYTDENGESKTELYIPATTLKGMLRNQMEMNIKTLNSTYSCNGKSFADSPCNCVMCRLFGKAGFQPSRVIIDNLYPVSATQLENRTNVAINRYTRKAEDGMLVTQETVSASDEQLFEGNMTVYYIGDLRKYEKALVESFKMIDSIGSSKSRGLGYVGIEVVEL